MDRLWNAAYGAERCRVEAIHPMCTAIQCSALEPHQRDCQRRKTHTNLQCHPVTHANTRADQASSTVQYVQHDTVVIYQSASTYLSINSSTQFERQVWARLRFLLRCLSQWRRNGLLQRCTETLCSEWRACLLLLAAVTLAV
jgi:hypothetical protein